MFLQQLRKIRKWIVPAEIATEHLPDKSPEDYHYGIWSRVCCSYKHMQKIATTNNSMVKLLLQIVRLSKKLRSYP
jgi:hypothetical protein